MPGGTFVIEGDVNSVLSGKGGPFSRGSTYGKRRGIISLSKRKYAGPSDVAPLI